MIHDLMLYLDNLDGMAILKAGLTVIVLLMVVAAIMENGDDNDSNPT